MIEPILGLGAMGLVFGGVLGVAANKLAVEVDPRVETIDEFLPGANCGACGYAGCSQFAEKVASGEAPVNGCLAGGADLVVQIAEVLGVSSPSAEERLVAFVACLGDDSKAASKFDYHGVPDCKAAMMYGGGFKSCQFGCLGLGTCEKVCPFEAITMGENGFPVIDNDKCTGCSKCKNTCPKKVIRMGNADAYHTVKCNSTEKGKAVKAVCDIGCIGCGICRKNCPADAIELENSLAKIDSNLCNNCGTCVEKCPRDTII